MALKEILRGIVEECGCLGAVVMGYDGIAIDECLNESAAFDVPSLAVEYASVLKEIKRTVGVLKTGELEEVAIVAERLSVLVRGLDDDLFVALVMGEGGNLGKGRYLLKREAPRLRAVLQ